MLFRSICCFTIFVSSFLLHVVSFDIIIWQRNRRNRRSRNPQNRDQRATLWTIHSLVMHAPLEIQHQPLHQWLHTVLRRLLHQRRKHPLKTIMIQWYQFLFFISSISREVIHFYLLLLDGTNDIWTFFQERSRCINRVKLNSPLFSSMRTSLLLMVPQIQNLHWRNPLHLKCLPYQIYRTLLFLKRTINSWIIISLHWLIQVMISRFSNWNSFTTIMLFWISSIPIPVMYVFLFQTIMY